MNDQNWLFHPRLLWSLVIVDVVLIVFDMLYSNLNHVPYFGKIMIPIFGVQGLTALLTVFDIIRNGIPNKGTWILGVVIGGLLGPIIYLLNRDRLIDYARNY